MNIEKDKKLSGASQERDMRKIELALDVADRVATAASYGIQILREILADQSVPEDLRRKLGSVLGGIEKARGIAYGATRMTGEAIEIEEATREEITSVRKRLQLE